MIKLLEEIDEMLAAMECVAHGMEGRAITEMRGRIHTELSNSHKHSVMQAEGSDVRSEGEQLGNEAVAKSVSVELTDEDIKWLHQKPVDTDWIKGYDRA